VILTFNRTFRLYRTVSVLVGQKIRFPTPALLQARRSCSSQVMAELVKTENKKTAIVSQPSAISHASHQPSLCLQHTLINLSLSSKSKPSQSVNQSQSISIKTNIQLAQRVHLCERTCLVALSGATNITAERTHAVRAASPPARDQGSFAAKLLMAQFTAVRAYYLPGGLVQQKAQAGSSSDGRL
jgi:hypothetical protein